MSTSVILAEVHNSIISTMGQVEVLKEHIGTYFEQSKATGQSKVEMLKVAIDALEKLLACQLDENDRLDKMRIELGLVNPCEK